MRKRILASRPTSDFHVSQDAVLACKLDQGPLTGSWLYAVTDGHAGKSCVEFITSHLVPQLLTRSKDIPNITLDQFHSDVLRKHAEGLQAALCDTFVSLHNQFCETGDLSGATLTVAILSCYGRLLTLCNVGDSEAIIDTGLSIFEATSSHRIHDMLSEQERLKKAGYTVAALGVHLAGPAKEGEPSIGPLRVWPGGLCPSRSIGDVDAGPGVVPVPHIRQIVVPNQGCRLIIASDGLWDNCSHSKAAATCRNLSPEDAANALCAIGSSQNARVRDDCSVIVVDILNPRHGRGKERTFAQVASSLNAPLKPPKPMNLGSTFMSFLKNAVAPAPQLDNIPYSHTLDSGPGHLIPLYDVDCINAYYPPDITNGLVKSWLEAIMAKQSVSVKALSSRGELLTQLSSQYTDAGTASFPSLDSTMSSRLSESGIVAGQSLPVDDVAVTKDGELNQGMNLTRLKSVTQYRSNQKAIADKDLKSKLKEGTNTAVEMPTLPEFDNVDIDHDDLDDDDEEDESYDFARDAAKEAASLAVQAALDRANARAVQSSTQGKALSDSSVHDETSSPSTARMPVPPSLPLQSKPG